MPKPMSINLTVPAWAWDIAGAAEPLPTQAERMELVVRLLEHNIADGGGPFAAAVFDGDGRLVAPGINRVVPDAAPIAHAEIVAIAAAGQQLGTWDLRSRGEFELVTSTEPCAMCLGAVPWSGVTRLVIGARDTDARDIGFDEGDKPARWTESLTSRGIEVVRDVGRDRIQALMADYVDDGGPVYNGSSR